MGQDGKAFRRVGFGAKSGPDRAEAVDNSGSRPSRVRTDVWPRRIRATVGGHAFSPPHDTSGRSPNRDFGRNGGSKGSCPQGSRAGIAVAISNAPRGWMALNGRFARFCFARQLSQSGRGDLGAKGPDRSNDRWSGGSRRDPQVRATARNPYDKGECTGGKPGIPRERFFPRNMHRYVNGLSATLATRATPRRRGDHRHDSPGRAHSRCGGYSLVLPDRYAPGSSVSELRHPLGGK